MFLPCFLPAASRTSFAAGQMSTPVPSPSMNGMTGLSVTVSVPSAAIVILSAIRAGAYRASAGLIAGRPGRRAQQPALPVVAQLEGVVHERPRLPHLLRRLVLEQAQQTFVADDFLKQNRFGPAA